MLFSISTLAAISAFASAALGAALPVSANPSTIAKRALSGQATFYGGNTSGGQCSFTQYTLPSGVYGTALSDSNWSNAANCGACREFAQKCTLLSNKYLRYLGEGT